MTAPSSILTYELTEDSTLVAELVGDITEASVLVFDIEAPPGTVLIDLGGIKRLNSAGVREWIRFLRKTAAGSAVILERCSVPFVRQLNLTNQMARGAQIRSVALPYYCEECDAELSRVVEVSTLASMHAIPELVCPDCDEQMDFDDIPEAYLAFLEHREDAGE